MRTNHVGWMAAVMLTWAGVAWGQYAVGDGRGLDNNLQQGSGGANPNAGPRTYGAVGNSIVTGNVAGLGYFRGDVGYGGAGDFRGEVSGDSSFRFRANSLGASFGRAPTGGMASTPLQVYRESSTPGAGTAGAYRLGSISPSTVMGGGLQVVQPTTGLLSSESLTGEAANSLGYVSQGNGQLMEIRASPLLGVRGRAMTIGPTAADGSSGTISGLDALSAQALEDQQKQDDRTLSSTRLDNQLGGGQLSSTLVQPVAPLDEQVARIQQQGAGPEGTVHAKPGGDVYMDLLARIQQQQAGGAEAEKKPLEEGQTRVQLKPTPEPVTATEGEAAPPSEEEAAAQAEAKAKEEQARRQAAGLPLPRETAKTAKGEDQAKTEEQPKAKEQAGGLALKYDLPAIHTMAGEEDTRINHFFRQAEGLMAEGQYFRAGDVYVQILNLRPGEPMARTGQIHAQIGAGMIRSAALNLRRLYEDHPELIAARYEARLLPSGERLELLHNELEEMIQDGNNKTLEAPLVLAYLGRQTGQQEDLDRGLALLEGIAPSDSLVVLLRTIWIEPAPAATQPTTQPAAEEKNAGPDAAQTPPPPPPEATPKATPEATPEATPKATPEKTSEGAAETTPQVAPPTAEDIEF
ncbi:MAG: hypothetical protein IT443_12985 [Phycisphaeraceae bacterium]|nr:hypothetical protein [Phycisphaeraceae bacterium]